MTSSGKNHKKTHARTPSTPRSEPPPEPTGSLTAATKAIIKMASTSAPSQRRSFAGFDRERATYQRHKSDLLATAAGKYVVIVGNEVVGPLESHQEAESAGYSRFGLGPLYIKHVLAEEPVVEVTRFQHP